MKSRRRWNLAMALAASLFGVLLTADSAVARIDPCTSDACRNDCNYTCGQNCTKECTEETCYGTSGGVYSNRGQCSEPM